MTHAISGRLATVLAAIAVVTVSACTSNPGPSAPPARSYQEQALDIGRQFADCARHNNFPNFSDPELDQDGNLSYPGTSKEDYVVAGRNCGTILQQLPPNPNVRPPSPELFALQQQYAQCMRGNGFAEWPDPRADGSNPFAGTALGTAMEFGPVPQSLIDAREACRALEDRLRGMR
jgi:hypothetical protein